MVHFIAQLIGKKSYCIAYIKYKQVVHSHVNKTLLMLLIALVYWLRKTNCEVSLSAFKLQEDSYKQIVKEQIFV